MPSLTPAGPRARRDLLQHTVASRARAATPSTSTTPVAGVTSGTNLRAMEIKVGDIKECLWRAEEKITYADESIAELERQLKTCRDDQALLETRLNDHVKRLEDRIAQLSQTVDRLTAPADSEPARTAGSDLADSTTIEDAGWVELPTSLAQHL